MPANADIAKRQKQEPASLAELIGERPDVAIFNRFSKTSVECILYQSALIQKLEADLQELCSASDRDFPKIASANPDNPVRRKMEEIVHFKSAFDRDLLQYRQILDIPRPAIYDHSFVQEWLCEDRDIPLPPQYSWLNDRNDLLGLQSGEDDLFVSKFITELVAPLIRRILRCLKLSPRRPPGRPKLLHNYRADAKVRDHAVVFSILVGSLLPGASIIALYYIQNDVGRLVFVMTFSAVFVVCLRVFTACRRIEIFATAVALASVQVVFIGTSG